MEETKQVTEVRTRSNGQPLAGNNEHPQKVYAKKKVIFRAYQVIWYILGLVEALLAFRFILKALGANTGSGFTNFIYILSDPFALPFRGIFPTSVAQTNAIEWSTIVACIVYLIAAFGIVQLFQLIKPTNPQEVAENVDSQ
jgi:uncharacterized protein YggT (Ycf19 family)